MQLSPSRPLLLSVLKMSLLIITTFPYQKFSETPKEKQKLHNIKEYGRLLVVTVPEKIS